MIINLIDKSLATCDVRAIFGCIHGNNDPPTHLEFSIVPVDENGYAKSPPSLDFEDGLYVLLKPKKQNVISKAPSHLLHLLDSKSRAENVHWQLSGPQQPKCPGTIQCRYCYPRERSDDRSGLMWTLIRHDGEEDLDFRLFQVHHSGRRSSEAVQSECRHKITKRRRHVVQRTGPEKEFTHPGKQIRLQEASCRYNDPPGTYHSQMSVDQTVFRDHHPPDALYSPFPVSYQTTANPMAMVPWSASKERSLSATINDDRTYPKIYYDNRQPKEIMHYEPPFFNIRFCRADLGWDWYADVQATALPGNKLKSLFISSEGTQRLRGLSKEQQQGLGRGTTEIMFEHMGGRTYTARDLKTLSTLDLYNEEIKNRGGCVGAMPVLVNVFLRKKLGDGNRREMDEFLY